MEIDIEKSMRTYGDSVLRLAIVNTKNRAEAEDIFQEVFLKLFLSQNEILNRITCEEHLKNWLMQVTVRLCRDHTKSYWNKNTDGFGEKIDVADERSGRDYEAVENQSDVTKAVLNLPYKYRQVIHLFYYEEYTTKEIAEILGEDETATRSRLTRGRRMLEFFVKED
ncbi:RNA polymerase sigma-70 factor, ECF subfamily [Lachnospiraceae bacterium]|nr:RNA polymerase sigma-70 factor, ECF subfamily [Lachnospiraceae bacterium]